MTYRYTFDNIDFSFSVTESGKVLVDKLGLTENNLEGIGGYPLCRVGVTGHKKSAYQASTHIGASSENVLLYKNHTVTHNSHGSKVEISMQDGSMLVKVHLQFYTHAHTVRSWCEIQNTAEEVLCLEYVSSLSLNIFSTDIDGENEHISVYIPHNKWSQEVNWKKKSLEELGIQTLKCSSAKRFSLSSTGHWSSKEYLPMGAFENVREKHAAIWQIESNGSWNWEIVDARGVVALLAAGPCENENFWYKELKKGESFTSVTSAISFGKDINACIAGLTKYRRHIIDDRGDDSINPVIFNDYMNCLMANPSSEKVYPLIDLASELGCEYYVMDAGWYAEPNKGWWDTVGEWKENRQRFPEGIKAVFDYAKSKGLKTGMWLEIEVMGVNCPIAGNFPDECYIMRHGKKIIQRDRYHFDFRHPKVIEYVTSIVDRVVNEYGADYIKFDHNIDAGVGTEIDSNSFGDGLLGHCRALLQWKNDIRKKYPHLIIESCSSGGMRTDYATLSTGHLQSVSDQEIAVQNTILASCCPTALLPEQCGMWSYPQPEHSENEVITAMVNTLMLRPYISGKIHLCSQECKKRVMEAIELYKELRSDVSRALPFYPLGLTEYSDKFFCTAYKIDGTDKTRLCVWHLDGVENDEKFIPLENANNVKILYPLECNYGKAEIATGGINVTLQKDTSFFLEVG